MQKILSITLLLLFPMLLHAQRGQNTKPAWKPKHNVTKFLGIPVDGSKWTMIQKLKEKEFKVTSDFYVSDWKDEFYGLKEKKEKDMINSDQYYLTGQFNGEDVKVYVYTNHNKVWRILVMDQEVSDEKEIKARYNQLIRQFRSKKGYKEVKAKEVPQNEGLSFDKDDDNWILRNQYNDKYQVIFLQAPWDNQMPMREVWFEIVRLCHSLSLSDPCSYRIEICYDNLFNAPKDGKDL